MRSSLIPLQFSPSRFPLFSSPSSLLAQLITERIIAVTAVVVSLMVAGGGTALAAATTRVVMDNNNNNFHNKGIGTGRMRPIILDESRCPLGWSIAGEQCVQLQFEASRPAEAEMECGRMGAMLVDVIDAEEGEQPSAALLEDLSEILEEALNAGASDQTWLVSSGPLMPEWDATNERVQFRPMSKESSKRIGNKAVEIEERKQKEEKKQKEEEEVENNKASLGLRRRRGKSLFELVLLSNASVQPFICALTPLWRRVLLYQQALLPMGAPKLEKQPDAAYSFDPSSAALSSSLANDNATFLSLPCTATGNPLPSVRWFRNGGDEVDLNSTRSAFVVSGGALLIPLSRLPSSPTSFYCLASNQLGTVRSQTATIRPAFIEPFRESRLDAYPLIVPGMVRGGGARLECNAPRHYPKSFSFSWVRGGSYEKFVEVSPRLFISMDGTLYFAYNVREDEDRWHWTHCCCCRNN